MQRRREPALSERGLCRFRGEIPDEGIGVRALLCARDNRCGVINRLMPGWVSGCDDFHLRTGLQGVGGVNDASVGLGALDVVEHLADARSMDEARLERVIELEMLKNLCCIISSRDGLGFAQR